MSADLSRVYINALGVQRVADFLIENHKRYSWLREVPDDDMNEYMAQLFYHYSEIGYFMVKIEPEDSLLNIVMWLALDNDCVEWDQC